MSDTATTKAARHYPAGRPKVQPFARYEGTSAWRKDRRRARAYALFRAAVRASELRMAKGSEVDYLIFSR